MALLIRRCLKTKLYLWFISTRILQDVTESKLLQVSSSLSSYKLLGQLGIVESIKESFKTVSIDDLFHKLVGFGADGANVNRGNKEGVKAILRRENPSMNFGWCVPHRLELSLKDSLQGTVFDEIDEVILRMHYLYKKAPKKLRQLKQLVDIYDEGDEFETGGYRPKKASGPRWIAHKVAALDVILDKYGIYLQHLENISEDNSFPAEDRAKCEGWLRKWSEARIPLLIALFIEDLAPAKCLSKSFQVEDIDVVASIEHVEKTKRQLDRISRKELELPTDR